MIKVLGRTTSSNVQSVMWTLAELGLDYSREDIGGIFGGNDTADYLAKNPMGLVPVLEDDGLTLFESAAIVRYLGGRYGDDRFYPADPSKRAKLDIWAEWAKTTFYPVLIGQVFFPLVRADPAELNQAALDASVRKLGQLATVLDQTVRSGEYSDGENLTFADIQVGHLLYRYYEVDFPKLDLPHLAAYYENLTSRPAYQDHVMVSFEPLRWASP